MSGLVALLKEKLGEVLRAMLPLIALVTLLQVVLVQAPLALFVQFLVGSGLAIAGMALLFIGVELGILPMGRFIGAELPKRGSLMLIVAVAFALGFATTVAEPDVLVLAEQVDSASQGAIRESAVLYVMALGVAIFTALAMARIVLGVSLQWLLTAALAAMLGLSLLAPPQFLPLAYDAGSVTTGVLTTPVVISLALGLSAVLAGRSAASDGFGLLGFASIGAVIAVLLMGLVLA